MLEDIGYTNIIVFNQTCRYLSYGLSIGVNIIKFALLA